MKGGRAGWLVALCIAVMMVGLATVRARHPVAVQFEPFYDPKGERVRG